MYKQLPIGVNVVATSLNNNPGTVTEVKPGGTYLIKFGDGNLDSVIARNDVSPRLPNIHKAILTPHNRAQSHGLEKREVSSAFALYQMMAAKNKKSAGRRREISETSHAGKPK